MLSWGFDCKGMAGTQPLPGTQKRAKMCIIIISAFKNCYSQSLSSWLWNWGQVILSVKALDFL